MSRSNSTRVLLSAGAAMAALIAVQAHAQSAVDAAPAQAAETATSAAFDAGDIVVVARKREERLIDVPIAITALSADTLSKAQAVDLAGVQGTIPNVNLVQGRGSTSNANIFIRGIGQPDALQTFDPAVGVI